MVPWAKWNLTSVKDPLDLIAIHLKQDNFLSPNKEFTHSLKSNALLSITEHKVLIPEHIVPKTSDEPAINLHSWIAHSYTSWKIQLSTSNVIY